MNELVSNTIDAGDLDRVCELVNNRFPYTILGNNCQNFSIRVLRQLVIEGALTMQEFDDVRARAHNTVTSHWRRIRANTEDLRLEPEAH